jgi:hypothetical protein
MVILMRWESKPITINNMCSISSLPLKTSDLAKQLKHWHDLEP